jgi:hypothetical protein
MANTNEIEDFDDFSIDEIILRALSSKQSLSISLSALARVL